MITVISGSNRKGSECLKFAKKYAECFEAKTKEEIRLLSLEDMTHDWFHANMYDEPSQSLIQIQNEYLLTADKFFFVLSEYNGSLPGSLKLFLDAVSVREKEATFKNKKAALAGVASGRAGNLRGMDHLTTILHHLGTIVMPTQIPISSIHGLLDNNFEIIDTVTIAVMEQQVEEFLEF
jgi:NAD(P)H-dependent FMN reductase